MGKTITEKILSTASGNSVVCGDFGWAKIHVVSMMDSLHFCDWEFFDRHHAKVWDPTRVLFSFDHFMYPQHGLGVAGFKKIREWAARHGVPKENIFDVGRQGLSHQIPAEEGWVLPGTVYIGADTQAATLGAFNCFAVAALAETPFIMATGDTWFKVPECVRISFRGRLPKGVLGKDIYLRLLQDLQGVAEGRVVEFAGPGIASLPLDVRMAVANGAPHLGALTMIFPSDQILLDYLAPKARESFEPVAADADAQYAAAFEYDLAEFEPLISGPHDPSKVRRLSDAEPTRIHAAYIGSCSSGRLEDLALAAEILKGRRIHPNVRMVVTPISSKVMQAAAEAGHLTTFIRAGATVTAPGCGACFYGNQSPLHLDDDEVCITGSVENWPGRMGSNKARIYLANAATVAASALEGQFANPAKYFSCGGSEQ